MAIRTAPMQPPEARPRRFFRPLVAGIFLLNVLVIGMAALTLDFSRGRYLADAFVATQNLVQLLEHDLTVSFDKVDLVLLDIQEEAEGQLAQGKLRPAELDSLMARQVFRLPEINALRIANPQGALVYGAGPPQRKPVNIADRDYFIRLRDDASAGIVISAPLQSRIDGQWSIVLGRRLSLPDGTFAGIVYAAMRLERIQNTFAALNLGGRGAVSLRDSELRLLARHPRPPGGDELIGSRVVSSDLLQKIEKQPQAGSYLATTRMDHIERANSYRRMAKYPFYILVGLATDDFLAGWQAEAAKTAAFALAFCLVSLLLAWQVGHAWKQREGDLLALRRQEASLRESEERFRLLVEGIEDYAIYMLSPEGMVMNWNRGAEKIKQWRSEEIVGRHFSVFYPAELIAAGVPERHLATAARCGHCRDEQWRLRKDGSTFWAAIAITAIRDANGELRGFAKLVRNITERRRNELQQRAHNAVLDRIVTGAPLPALLALVIDGIGQQLPGALCAILTRDVFGSRLSPVAASHSPTEWAALVERLEIDPDHCCGCAVMRGERLLLGDLPFRDDCPCCRLLAEASGLAACWVQPIRGERGDILGVLLIGHRQAGAPDAYASGVLDHEAKLAGIAIERSRSNEALTLAASVYQAIGEAIIVVGADNRILAVNPAFTRLTGYHPAEIVGKDPGCLSSGRQDRAFYQRMWHALDATGHWQGEISNRHKDGHILTQWLMISTHYDEQNRVQRRIGLYSEVTDQKRAEEAMLQHANYDPLTQLPNRRLFMDRLDHEIRKARRESSSLTLMLIDLDHFKPVNDTFGHDAGDRLLVEAARRIRECVRETDTVARLGGDEFTVILAGNASPERVEAVAGGIVAALEQPFPIGMAMAKVAGSVGIASFPRDAEGQAELLKNADRAMYAAKQSGRGCFRHFTEINVQGK